MIHISAEVGGDPGRLIIVLVRGTPPRRRQDASAAREGWIDAMRLSVCTGGVGRFVHLSLLVFCFWATPCRRRGFTGDKNLLLPPPPLS